MLCEGTKFVIAAVKNKKQLKKKKKKKKQKKQNCVSSSRAWRKGEPEALAEVGVEVALPRY